YFEGEQEIVGTVIIPQVVGLLLAILPLLGYGRMRPIGHVIGVVVLVGLLAGVAALTCLAVADDMLYPLARATLANIALRVIPIIAFMFIVYLAVLALLRPSRLRKAVQVGGLLTLVGLFLGTALLAYGAMKTDERFAVHERGSPQDSFTASL